MPIKIKSEKEILILISFRNSFWISLLLIIKGKENYKKYSKIFSMSFIWQKEGKS